MTEPKEVKMGEELASLVERAQARKPAPEGFEWWLAPGGTEPWLRAKAAPEYEPAPAPEIEPAPELESVVEEAPAVEQSEG